MAVTSLSAGPGLEILPDTAQLDLNALITKDREGFIAVELTGDSITDRIKPGSLVFIDTWREPKNGDLIAAEVDGLVNAKIFRHDRRGLYLVPANKDYEPRQITANNAFRILGVIVGSLSMFL